jgi:hypothetical protein
MGFFLSRRKPGHCSPPPKKKERKKPVKEANSNQMKAKVNTGREANTQERYYYYYIIQYKKQQCKAFRSAEFFHWDTVCPSKQKFFFLWIRCRRRFIWGEEVWLTPIIGKAIGYTGSPFTPDTTVYYLNRWIGKRTNRETDRRAFDS